jgi:peptidoglycan/LPS O-acetylase OafA/YrhL
MENNQRIFGLDLMRALAIGMVLLAQLVWIFPQTNAMASQLASLFHFIGPEILFVLAGFLLGSSMYKLYIKENFGWEPIAGYLKRSAVRILPLYFMILVINFGISFLIGYQVDQGWKYFLLLQNFDSPMPAFFSESWILPIIVFSTVLFSITLYLLDAAFKPKNKPVAFLALTLLLLFAFVALKGIYNSFTTNTSIIQWDASLKSVAIYRLDAVFMGVLFSWMRQYNPPVFKKMKIPAALLGCIGSAFIIVGVGYFQLLIENHKLFWNVIYLPLTSLTISFFLPILSAWRTPFTIIKKPVKFLGKIAYAVYFVHFGIVFQLMHYYFPNPEFILLFASLYLIIVLVLGIIMHQFFQKRLQKMNNPNHSVY